MHNQILQIGTLVKNETPYFIRPLNEMGDFIQSDLLQSQVLASLPTDQTLIHPQSWKGFMRRYNGKDAITLGVFAGSATDENPMLIAQQTLRLSADEDIPLLNGLDSQKMGCLEGFMVHPSYRGNKLTDILMHLNHQIGEKMGLVGFVSCADASNPYSYNNMLLNGYGITGSYIDEDGGETYAFTRFNQPSVQIATILFMPKIESGHFDEIHDMLNSATKPAIIYQYPTANRVCAYSGPALEAFNSRAYQPRSLVGA